MNTENNCKWFFPICSEGAHERGLNNAMSEHFKSQSQYTTLVRESIQNSLDAVLDESKPVVVKFSFLPLKQPFEEVPNLMDIKKHIKGCIDYWSSNPEIRNQYQPMLSYIDNSRENLSYLKVSDYNTKGMDYRDEDNNCTFFAFLRAEGTSVKNMINSGGSFGFGKMAYFGLSNFRTILVSTMNQKHEVTFEGSCMLCTNKVDGVKYMDSGYYDCNNGKPITDSNEVPKIFQRNEPGTDINIMGISYSRESMELHKQEIIKAVLTHFWMAIHEQKLEVVIGHFRITKDTLVELMKQYFDNKLDAGTKYENPRAYYETVIGAEENRKDCKLYEKDIVPLGKSRFYIARNRGSRDRYVAMRNPRMIVQMFNSQSCRGYSGVFICDDKQGNEILKITEPPAHDKWDRNRVLDKYSPRDKKARKALTEIRKFATECITDFFKSAEQDTTDIRGIDQFLYGSADINKATDIGSNVTSREGQKTSEYTDTENGAPVSSLDIQPRKPNKDDNIGYITKKDSGLTSPKGDLYGGNSTKKLETRIPNPKPRHGTTKINNTKHQDDNGVKTNIERPIKVTYRCFALQQDGKCFHKLVFHSEQDINDVVLRLKTATADPGKMEEIPIVWSSQGKFADNKIEGINVKQGKNIVKFRFNDNLVHAIILEAYYEEK